MADLLLVDDDWDVAQTLSEVLLAEGYTVRIARNGEQGLAELARRQPDVVLLDVEMPVLTGPEMAYQMLIRDCGLEAIPIVLLSGVIDLPVIATLVRTPYFLAKPFLLDSVLSMVARALSERAYPGMKAS